MKTTDKDKITDKRQLKDCSTISFAIVMVAVAVLLISALDLISTYFGIERDQMSVDTGADAREVDTGPAFIDPVGPDNGPAFENVWI